MSARSPEPLLPQGEGAAKRRMRAGFHYKPNRPRKANTGSNTRFHIPTDSRFPPIAMSFSRPSATFSGRAKRYDFDPTLSPAGRAR